VYLVSQRISPYFCGYLSKNGLNPENKGKSAVFNLPIENCGQRGPLLVADFPQMNFSQMHERLRLELLRRIQRGTLSVSLLARQTGFGQSHISNFLNSRRQLSLEALDRVLVSQHINAGDLLPVAYGRADLAVAGENGQVPVISHAAAASPACRPSCIRSRASLEQSARLAKVCCGLHPGG
jgi:hypothetical protein